jgi:hypothetical protein
LVSCFDNVMSYCNMILRETETEWGVYDNFTIFVTFYKSKIKPDLKK